MGNEKLAERDFPNLIVKGENTMYDLYELWQISCEEVYEELYEEYKKEESENE